MIKSNILEKKILIFTLLSSLFFIFTFLVPSSQAHVVIIADGDSSSPELVTEAENTAQALDAKGYEVLKLYQKNATTKKIMKGMYNADAVIYLGHGGYVTGHYDEQNGGPASSPFAMVGSDDFIWGVDDQMRESWDGKLFTAPYKSNIPVILAHTCFSTGYVGDQEVSNPTATIYNFSRMFTGAGANYYATGYYGSYQEKTVVDIVDKFLNGATSFKDANTRNKGRTITKSTTYNGEAIWRNDHGWNAFVGDWNATFPTASQTTPYNDQAAEAWYQYVILGNTDTKPPTINSTNPNKGATGVSLTSPVTITFSENIIAHYNFSKIYIKNLNTGSKVSLASKLISGKILTLKMVSDRSSNTAYQVYIPASAVSDAAGNRLTYTYSYSFKTTTDTTVPKISRTTPANNATGVSLTSSIIINFSENIKSGSNYSGIYIKNLTTGKKVTLSPKTISGKTLTLKMASSRLRNNVYRVYIPVSAVKDAAGNSLKSSYSFQFRTVK